MRTRSIIYIIRRYGLSSKRLNPNNRIRYDDAINGLRQYESSELKIEDVIDNVLNPDKSISCNCQIPGCNHRIRYEYVLRNKKSGDDKKIVAGSTCVWPTLGLSELQKKEFIKYETVVKDHNDMVIWRKENPDVVEKLEKAEENNLIALRPFWEEIQYCSLLDEDTEYIRSIDVDKMVSEKKENERKRQEYLRVCKENGREKDEEYQRVIDGLKGLVEYYPNNKFYRSLERIVNRGYKLSENQMRYVKIGCNRVWYEKNIKGTNLDVYDRCEDILKDIFQIAGFSEKDINDRDMVNSVNTLVRGKDRDIIIAWNVFKVKHEVVL